MRPRALGDRAPRKPAVARTAGARRGRRRRIGRPARARQLLGVSGPVVAASGLARAGHDAAWRRPRACGGRAPSSRQDVPRPRAASFDTWPVRAAARRRADGRRADRRVGAAAATPPADARGSFPCSRRRLQRRRAAARPRGGRRPQRAPRSDAGLGRVVGAGQRRACRARGRDRRHDRADDDAGAPRAVRPRARALEPRTRHRAGAVDRCRDR